MRKRSLSHSPLGFISLLLLLGALTSAGQHPMGSDVPAHIQIRQMTEAIYATDDELINGTIYAVPNPAIFGDPYLNGPEWQQGELFIHGRNFPDQQLKYDLVMEEIILSAPAMDDSRQIMMLNKSQIDSFRIGPELFVHSRTIFPETEEQQFYGKVFTGKLPLFRKYRKTFINSYNSTTPVGKFSGLKSDLLMLEHGQLKAIPNPSSFLGLFPAPMKNQIRKYMRDHRIKLNKATSREITAIFEYSTNQGAF